MNADRWASRLCWILDLLSLTALAAAGEVRLELFAFVALAFVLSRVKGVRIPSQVALAFLCAIVMGAIGAWLKFRFHPIISAAYAAPLVHLITWFLEDTGRNRAWRMGVGFVELILASAMTAEVYLFLTIFAYVIFGAVAVSCGFLDAELRKRAPEQLGEPLPAGFVSRSMGLALLIFLSSAILFPILPRMRVDVGYSSDRTKVGYTENVSLTENLRLNGAEGTGQAVLRLYPRKDVDLTFEIDGGLIRGKALDFFDGTHWAASQKRNELQAERFFKPGVLSRALTVDVVRSPMSTQVLPVPYGAINVFQGRPGEEIGYPRLQSGEWIDPSSTQERSRYSFTFLPVGVKRELSPLSDPPLSADRFVPEALRSERMLRLAKSIFEGATSETEKVDRLRNYLSREGFTAALGESSLPDLSRNPAAQKMHPMERFLFITKEGHCEWFASASAVLLRLADVPTRLVAGFRITRGAVGGVLTLTTNDAHAWLEYWHPTKGWMQLDPTPRLLRPPSLLNVFRDAYDWVSNYWFRYVLGYNDKHGQESGSIEPPMSAQGTDPGLSRWETRFREAILGNWVLILGVTTALALLAGLAYAFIRWKYPWLLSIRYRVREGENEVRRERIRMERLLGSRFKRKQISIEEGLTRLSGSSNAEKTLQALQSWQSEYHRIRFGKPSESRGSDVSRLAVRRREVRRSWVA